MSRIYDTAAWKRLRAKVLRANPFCSTCTWEGRPLTPATEVDHITPIEQGGAPLDEANLNSYCKPCHSRKTRLVDSGKHKAVPIKGCDPKTGKPLDSGHWWRTAK